jgi:hypothetical protein
MEVDNQPQQDAFDLEVCQAAALGHPLTHVPHRAYLSDLIARAGVHKQLYIAHEDIPAAVHSRTQPREATRA